MTTAETSTEFKHGWRSAWLRGLARLSQSLSDFFARNALRAELVDLARRGALDVTLEDMGITRAEMDRVVRSYPEAGRLRGAMTKRLGIDIGALEPRTRYALEQTCALCIAHRRCSRWLARPGSAADGYHAFCPNASLFDATLNPAQHI